MSAWVALSVFATVLVFCTFLLRISGTWRVLFAQRLQLDIERNINPLATSPRGWIENHEFWDLVDTDGDQDAHLDAEQAFWGEHATRDVG